MIPERVRGRRRQFSLTILGEQGSYPSPRLRLRDSLYFASRELVYCIVPSEAPNEYSYSETSWISLGEIRLLGALAFSIKEGDGFYSFWPTRRQTLCLATLDEATVHRYAGKLIADIPGRNNELHWVSPDPDEVSALYEALHTDDNVLLRGVSCFLKAHLFWGNHFFIEEMGVNLHISLEAGLSVLRKRISGTGPLVSYDEVYEFVAETLQGGDALAEFWIDRRDERNMMLHPDSYLGPYAILPMLADDVLELLAPMLTLYRFILIGADRPSFR